jgi:hypothetical protein
MPTLPSGIAWAYLNGAWVLNNSWKRPASTAITAAISKCQDSEAAGSGAVVVFSAGNDNVSTVSYPASLQHSHRRRRFNMCDQRKTTDEQSMQWE